MSIKHKKNIVVALPYEYINEIDAICEIQGCGRAKVIMDLFDELEGKPPEPSREGLLSLIEKYAQKNPGRPKTSGRGRIQTNSNRSPILCSVFPAYRLYYLLAPGESLECKGDRVWLLKKDGSRLRELDENDKDLIYR